ncbi:hypothetical protein DSM25558_5384 [Agrobacterium sp. DSM 25558]|nr:hypothetical protein DSM25558_5384 [Agrobacterium sp. DSM 25558]
MAYDWSGGRVRRFRQIKIWMTFSAVFFVFLIVGALYGTL